MLDPGLPHDGIGRVARLDLAVDRDVAARDRAVPNVMIALAVAHERATACGENLPNVVFVVRHQGAATGLAILTVSSARM